MLPIGKKYTAKKCFTVYDKYIDKARKNRNGLLYSYESSVKKLKLKKIHSREMFYSSTANI